jgi:hypothetical protein
MKIIKDFKVGDQVFYWRDRGIAYPALEDSEIEKISTDINNIKHYKLLNSKDWFLEKELFTNLNDATKYYNKFKESHANT